LEKAENRKNRIILGITLAMISIATLVFLSSIGIQIRSSLSSFPQILLEMITLIANWIVFINQLSDIITPLVRVSFKLISPIWLYTLALSLSGITAAWLFSALKARTIHKELNS
jgi:hypothetical protein